MPSLSALKTMEGDKEPDAPPEKAPREAAQ
jgi:hypothetical protein